MRILRKLQALLVSLSSLLPQDLVLLISRLAIASVFWRSAQTKISGWEFLDQSWQFFNLSSSTFLLFQYEYNLPLLPPKPAAYLATSAEFFLPLLLVFGFSSRLCALGLLGMTAVIQFLVLPGGWPTHILWLAVLLLIFKEGSGRISIDHLIKSQGNR